MSFTEYYKFLGASQGVQAPVLKEAIQNLKDDDGKFSLKDLSHEIVNVINSKANNDYNYYQWYGWNSTLIKRIDKIVEDDRIINIIDSDEDTIQNIIEGNDEIIIINADFDKDELDITMYLFSKLLLKYSIEKRNSDEKFNLIVLLISVK